MANDLDLSTAGKNAAMDAVTALIDAGSAGGKIKIYDGTKPAGPNTAISTQTLLATLTLSTTGFGAASGGVATANTITAGTAVATGTASWARITDSDDNAVIDVTVGTSGCDINLTSVALSSGISVGITSATLTHP